MNKKLMLIDGNSLINRAFYAMPLLSNKDGIYTNAVYGFLNIFFRFFDEENPDYVCVSFDLPKPTHRHLKYTEYKGTRKSMPDELRPQIPLLKELLVKMNIAICELEGFEADDLLGTLAVAAEKDRIVPVIVSGDRDLLQIASDTIKIRIPKTKAGKTEVEDYSSKEVIEKYGVTPTEFIDVKALMGDASDNIPGVPSIGEKTAIKIIKEYKNIECAIENAADIKPKKASENLIQYKEQAILSKELATIVTNAPISLDYESAKADDIFNNDVLEFFKKYNFKSLLNRFKSSFIENTTPNLIENKELEVDFKEISELNEARMFVTDINPFESTAYKIIVENSKVLGISFSNNDNKGVYLAVSNDMTADNLFSITRDFFEGDNKKIAHDAKKDIFVLNKYGIELNNLEIDVLIAGYLINATSSSYEFNDIAYDFLEESYQSEEDILGKGKSKISIMDLKPEDRLNFVCRFSDIMFRAKDKMVNIMEEYSMHDLYYTIEQPLIYVLASMEKEGIFVDKEELLEYKKELEDKLNELTKDIYWLAGEEFNINSPKQVGYILFDKLELKGGKKTKTGWSTSADILEKMKYQDKIVSKILEYRTYSKLFSTYAEGLLNVRDEDTGKIYSTFNQAVTATGRISSTDPNLQNIPIKIELGHRIRKVFKPLSEDYIFIDADYSQIELRVLAHLANDENLIRAFNEGQDIHRLTASQVFNVNFDKVTTIQRSNAKAVNFGIIYGKQAFSLSDELSISIKEADAYIKGYFEKYPSVREFMDNVIAEAKKTGYTKTMFNRIRKIPEINSPNFLKRSAAERVAMNMPIQGSAADIIKIAMVKVYNRLKEENLRSKLILQVHDELLVETHVLEAEKVQKILKEEMENAVNLSVPLEIDIHEGKNWYETK